MSSAHVASSVRSTQGQEATKTNGRTLTESRGKNDLKDSMDLSTPLGIDWTITTDDTAQFPMVSFASFCLPVRRSTCSFKLICSSPGFAELNQSRSRVSESVLLAPRPTVDISALHERVIRQASPDPFVLRASPLSSGHKFVATRCTLNSVCPFVSM